MCWIEDMCCILVIEGIEVLFELNFNKLVVLVYFILDDDVVVEIKIYFVFGFLIKYLVIFCFDKIFCLKFYF